MATVEMPGSLTSEIKPSTRGGKGERTRARLIEAARRVFERDGYLEARVTDITADAGMSSGSFYTYFDGKEDVFAAVVEEFQDEMLNPGLEQSSGDGEIVDLIGAANRDYVESVRKNARLVALFEQVANVDDGFREMRQKRAKSFAARNAKVIQQLQDEDRIDPELDPVVASHALSVMISRMAFDAYVLGEHIPVERLLANLNRLWANALRLDSAPVSGGGA